MLANQLASVYAQAIYELADSKNLLDGVEQELKLVDGTIREHAELSGMMYHPMVPPQAKRDVLNQLFAEDLTDFVRNFLLLLVDKRRETAFPAIVKEYISLANAKRNIAEAEVITAVPLTAEQQQALTEKLSGVTGKRITLLPRVDKSIMGGVVVNIGGKLIDGSVAGKIQSMKAALLKG